MSNVVDTAVDKEIRTYSQALSQSIKEFVLALCNWLFVIVFGLAEEMSENLDRKVRTLFETSMISFCYQKGRILADCYSTFHSKFSHCFVY